MSRYAVWAAAAAMLGAGVWTAAYKLSGGSPSPEAARRLKAIRRDGQPDVRIFKSRRELVLYVGGQEAWRTRVALGSAPIGDKQREGDGKTPEGDFYVCTRNSGSSFHRFLV